jgi:hypothetical protein
MLKAWRKVRVPVPYVEVIFSANCEACNEAGSPATGSAVWYMLAVEELASRQIEFDIHVDGLVSDGDRLIVWLSSPGPLYVAAKYCEKKSNQQQSDSVEQFCKAITSLGKICEAGFVAMPDVFVAVLKEFGYYNDKVVAVAKTVANSGVVRGPYETFLSDVSVEGEYVVSMAKYEIEGGAYRRKSLKLKLGDELTAEGDVSAFDVIEGSGSVYVKFASVNEAVIDVPVPYAMRLELSGGGKKGKAVVNPFNLAHINDYATVGCPHVILESESSIHVAFLGGACSLMHLLDVATDCSFVPKEGFEESGAAQTAVAALTRAYTAIYSKAKQKNKDVFWYYPVLEKRFKCGTGG